MRAFTLFILTAFALVHTVALTAADSLGRSPNERASEPALPAILALDAAIQKRFEKFDGRFGIVRVAVEAHKFTPENDAEMSSLRELNDAGLRVALYLGSRRLLAPQQPGTDGDGFDRIKGPRLITRGPFPATPVPQSMDVEARRAFAAFERQDRHYQFVAGKWNVVARPVRAVDYSCLNCHLSTGVSSLRPTASDLRVGDVIGVVLYAYQAAN
jgi:hypothetical protein